MSVKTILYIIAAAILILFIAFNLNNTSDISFIFATLEEVPVFFTVFISILIGVLIMLPMTLTARAASPKKPKKDKKKKSTPEDEIASIEAMLEDQPAPEQPKKRGLRKKEKYGEAEKVSDTDIRE